jgi:hypothetical protein
MDLASVQEISATPGLDLPHCGNDDADLDRQRQLLMNRSKVALAETLWAHMVGALLAKLGYDEVQLVHMERLRVLYFLLVKDRPGMTDAITNLSEIISIRYKRMARELHDRGSGQGGGMPNILTPSLVQKRRLLILPRENSPVFESFDTVVPALLTAPQARISDADLVSIVKCGDLNQLDQLFRTRQASPLDILENNMTFLQVSYSYKMNCLRFILHILGRNNLNHPE